MKTVLRVMFLGVLLCWISISLKAQEQTLFFINPYSFNPSYAGVEGKPAFYLNYRNQWVNVDGSPKTGNFSFHTPLKKYLNFGASINTDKRGLFNTTSGMVSAAYTVLLGDFKSMRFGISAGGGMSNINLDGIPDNTDPALLNAGNSFMQGSAGLSFHLKSFHGGISLPSLFQPSYISGGASSFEPLGNVVIHASNRFYWMKNKHMIEPHLLYRYSNIQPSQLEAALVYHVNNIVWLGGSYKQHFGNAAFGGIHFNKAFGIGYAYTFKTTQGNELNSPSHEVQLTLLLGTRRKDIPFYSFVDTDKEKRIAHHKYQPASEVIAQNRANAKPVQKQTPPPKEENHQARLPDQVSKPKPAETKPSQTKTVPPVVKKEEPKATPPADKPAPKTEIAKLGQMPHVHDTLHPAHEEEKEKIARLEIHAEDPTKTHTDPPAAHPHSERHEFVKRGGHSEELDIGDYVVAGVFRSKVNAEHFADGLKQHGFKADHGHLTLKNLWYVYIAQTDNIEAAKAERDKARKLLMFRDAWLLTVHH
jgi:type IX secretion system PorP/SprF family membrane protein